MARGATRSAARAANERREPEFEVGDEAFLHSRVIGVQLVVKVRVVRVREPDAMAEEVYYLVEPLAGTGRLWVRSENLEPHR